MHSDEFRSETPAARDPVEELAELFLERYRRGERPSLSEFTALAPAHAEEILELFPALVLMEQAQLAPARPGHTALKVGTLERVGDYRILREVGRGGMGIVFEAEQESLGRRVALKVLPSQSSASALLRFRREARSAARLHHTNIVPVFDVGERDGVHYYAMQFIQGHGLDEVIAELRQLRTPLDPKVNTRDAVDADNRGYDVCTRDMSLAGHGDVLSSSLSSTSDSGIGLFKRMATVGLQAAEALAYAHGQRVYHRDIKPANLLFDTCGTVWVTDFGLAKDDSDDLTNSGSVVGTLRYMAPERFRGISDAQSDVYGLGITLYELLTLRPAFVEADRSQLVRAIMQEEPSPPRKLDQTIPRDLETIVLKAIAKEPSHRYASAEDFAEDLRRFISDLPLQARRVASWERVGRWCRRNPGWTATLAVAIGLLLMVALGGTLLSLHLRKTVNQLQVSRELETMRLWQAHIERARALRSSNRVGQRFQALTSLREAAKIKVTRELRDEVVAALVLPDVEVAQEWTGYPAGTVYLAYDHSLEKYVRITEQGVMTLCQVTQQGEKVIAEVQTDAPTHLHNLLMSPDGRTIVFVRRASGNVAGSVEVWRSDAGGLVQDNTRGGEMAFSSIAFDSTGRRLVIGHISGTAEFIDLRADVPSRHVEVGAAPLSMAISPDGQRLAAACGRSIRVLDIETGQLVTEITRPTVRDWQYGLCWHPKGEILGAAGDDTTIHLWHISTAREVILPLEGHTAPGITLEFNHRGDRIISNSWDGQTRLWDTISGQLLFVMPAKLGTTFGPDDATLGLERYGEKLRIWRLADGRELRRLRRPLAGPKATLHSPVLQSDGNIMSAASNEGLAFFDLHTGNELAFAAFDNRSVAYPRGYDSTSGWWTGGRSGGAAVWPARRDAHRTDMLRVGPPETIITSTDVGMDLSADGRVRVIPRGDHALVLDRDAEDRRLELRPHVDVRHCAVSPDGTRVATFSWHSDGSYPSVRIWGNPSGAHIIDLPVKGEAWGSFSPNGRWLATFSTSPSDQLWDTSTWKSIRALPEGPACWVGADSWLASGIGSGQISITDPTTGSEILRLTEPLPQVIMPAFVTPDGTRLVAGIADGSALLVWDLSRIGRQVRDMGLEWNWPVRTQTNESGKLPPIREVAVDLGDWLETDLPSSASAQMMPE